MTTIDAIDSTTTGVDTPSSAPIKILGKDDFLNLLVTQLQHQDPLNPAESTEFTAQLAQFSSLEQLNNINDNLKNMELFQSSMTNSQAVSYIGKEITARGNSVQLTSDQPAQCNFELAAPADLAVISIYDAAGGFVNTFETGPLSAGHHSAVWDGTDRNGNHLPAGIYSFEVQAADADNRNLKVTAFIRALVTGVSFKDKTAHLITDLQTVGIEDVMAVSEVSPQPAAGSTNEATTQNAEYNGGK
ncbi:MAG: flagellar hook capping FlgD N-terminal domain-containing protein [Desulfobacterales bacterium]|jgi:flagellar basal-body rod modification protein FlgD